MKKCYVLILVISFYFSAFAQTQSIKVEAGWNLLSLPLSATDNTKRSLFPTAISDAFIYQNSYLPKDTLQNGYGFWLKFDSAETLSIVGDKLYDDTVEVNTGWNIIGSISTPVPIDSIKCDPPDIITSDFFCYSNGTYQPTDTLQPGIGCWVKVKQSGSIILYSIIQPPALTSPPIDATNISIPTTLCWNQSFGATSYTLQVSPDSLFSSYAYNQSGLTDTSQQISGLTISSKYYWHVLAKNTHIASGWSNTWSFTTTPIFPCGSAITHAGKTYNTVQIGSQCWLRENLDVGIMVDSLQNQTNNSVIEKYCYSNDQNNCNTYGGLYQWNEAMQYTNAPGAQGICPTGWHIPTQIEFQTCSTAVGGDGNSLKEIGQGFGDGAGTNTSGFSALLAGALNQYGHFVLLEDALFWSSIENTDSRLYAQPYDSYALIITLPENNPAIYIDIMARKNFGLSIRCLKDDGETNYPPSAPSHPTPIDNAINQPTIINFSWRGSQDREGDPLTYDVYFGTDNPPLTKLFTDIDTVFLSIGLTQGTIYYWQVFAKDNHSNLSPGPVWRFQTQTGGGSPCAETPTVMYEGKTYNTVQMGSQCWLRENLDVGMMVDSLQNQTNNSVIEKYCYNNDPNNCNTYGGLYQWNEAMQYTTAPGAQGICPAGWHIPTNAELSTLEITVNGDGNALKEIGQGYGDGAGTNTSGFSVLLAGYRRDNSTFGWLGSNACLWASTEYRTSYAYIRCLFSTTGWINTSDVTKGDGESVRCVKD
jgi:uncharacterized protein (TIGR02145 family)